MISFLGVSKLKIGNKSLSVESISRVTLFKPLATANCICYKTNC